MEAVVKPQAITLLIGLGLGCIGLIAAISAPAAVQVQGVKTEQSLINVAQPPVDAPKIKVSEPTSLPAATSEYLQGSSSLQQQDSNVGSPSNGASQLLQPNSGRSSFDDQDPVQ